MEFKVNTKFNIEESVHFLYENVVQIKNIREIEIKGIVLPEYGITIRPIRYRLLLPNNHTIWMEEKDLFKTKEELLKSL